MGDDICVLIKYLIPIEKSTTDYSIRLTIVCAYHAVAYRYQLYIRTATYHIVYSFIFPRHILYTLYLI